MNIAVVDRLCAHSHRPGHEVLIPGTTWKVRAFPVLLEIFSCETKEHISCPLMIEGPIDPFTVEQDIDSSCVRVYGMSRHGYFRLKIVQEESALWLHVEKGPNSLGPTRLLVTISSKKILSKERLFLGSYKNKDWTCIRKQRDLATLLPLWFALGNMTSHALQSCPLLDELRHAIAVKDKHATYQALINLYLAGFSEGLVPRRQDDEWQGILSHDVTDDAMSLLTGGAQCIRSCFIQEEAHAYHILPCVPSKFSCGKIFFLQTKQGDRMAIEWSKGRIRKMMLFGIAERALYCQFPKEIKNFRLRTNLKDRGSTVRTQEMVTVMPNTWLFFDRFME